MRKTDVAFIALILWAVGISFMAFNYRSQANKAYNELQTSNTKLNADAKKSVRLINETGKGTIYLAPKGATENQDGNADVVTKLIIQTFIYSSPEQFKEQAEYVKPRVTGEFYDYWLKNGIDVNYTAMKENAQGRAYKRFMKPLELTKFSNNEYLAIVRTGVTVGTTSESSVTPDLFILDITHQKDGRWKFERVPKAEAFQMIDDDDTGSDNDDNNY